MNLIQHDWNITTQFHKDKSTISIIPGFIKPVTKRSQNPARNMLTRIKPNNEPKETLSTLFKKIVERKRGPGAKTHVSLT